MGPTLDFGVVFDSLPALLWGCLGTIGLALAGMVLALAIGIGGVIARLSRFAWLRLATLAFVEIVRNTPFLVQIYFVFFALPLIGLRLNTDARRRSWPSALNGGAYAIEIIRGGVASHRQGTDRGRDRALGLHGGDVFRLHRADGQPCGRCIRR